MSCTCPSRDCKNHPESLRNEKVAQWMTGISVKQEPVDKEQAVRQIKALYVEREKLVIQVQGIDSLIAQLAEMLK